MNRIVDRYSMNGTKLLRDESCLKYGKLVVRWLNSVMNSTSSEYSDFDRLIVEESIGSGLASFI